MEQPVGTQGQSARRPRNNRRQTPLPTEESLRFGKDWADAMTPRRISSRGGRRAGLIPTAPIDPAANHLGNVMAGPDKHAENGLPDAAYICITCSLGPRPGHPLTRIDDNGGYVHRHGCPTKRIPPPPQR